MSLTYSLIENDGEQTLLVLVPGREPLVVAEDHPYFFDILEGARAGEEDVYDLADIGKTAGQKFQQLTDRVVIRDGRVYFDTVLVDNALTETLLRFIEAGVEDWKPLVKFYEKVESNPNMHSREQLYTWLANQDFSITVDGDIVGYKGVQRNADGSLVSISRGRALVDGVEHNGQIPNHIGAVVSMPREQVQFDPSVGCHTGLHVGTYEYASGFARGALLEVVVDPRNVVSIPTDCGAQKMRCCEYRTVAIIEQRIESPLRVYDAVESDEDYEDDDLWGDDLWEDEDEDDFLF